MHPLITSSPAFASLGTLSPVSALVFNVVFPSVIIPSIGPTPTFSACFGAAFLSLHPTKYAEELVKKMEKTGAKAYLVNTGWNGTGKRISIRDTRGIIDAILDGSIDKAPTKVIPYFDFVVPTELPGVDPKILDPRDTYADAAQWDEKAKDLAGRFIKNFAKFTGNEAGKKLVAAGPKL